MSYIACNNKSGELLRTFLKIHIKIMVTIKKKWVHMFLYNYSLNFVQQDTRRSTSASSISPPKELIALWSS
jgi:hypothetical protein